MILQHSSKLHHVKKQKDVPLMVLVILALLSLSMVKNLFFEHNRLMVVVSH